MRLHGAMAEAQPRNGAPRRRRRRRRSQRRRGRGRGRLDRGRHRRGAGRGARRRRRLLHDEQAARARRTFEKNRIAALERGLELKGETQKSNVRKPGELSGTVLGGKYRIGRKSAPAASASSMRRSTRRSATRSR